MLKKITCIILVLLMIMPFSSALAGDEITLVINGKKVETDVSPVIINDRTMVPVRVLFSTFGADVVWNELFRQVVITTDYTVMILTIDSPVAYVNGMSKTLAVPATIVNGRTLVPVRFVSENFGYDVEWNASKRIVYISRETSENETTPPESSTPKPQEPTTKPKDEPASPSVDNGNKIKFNSVTISDKSDSTTIKVSLSGNLTPKVMTLTSPDRIVLDFQGVSQMCDDGKKIYTDSAISAIRWASHEDYTRLVVESREKLQYNIDSTSSSCTLKVYVKNSNPDNEPDVNKPTIVDEAPLVVIDAGHGGNDCGAVGRDEDGNVVVYESQVNLDIALRVRERLVARGINVLMTRSTDVGLGSSVMADLVKRAEIANDADADLFVSIHNNAYSDPEATGTTVLYAGLSNSGGYGITSKKMAENIQKLLVKATGLKDRGITQSPGIVVLKRTDMPAVLLECGFVTSYNDQKILTNNNKLNEISDAICEGILISLEQAGLIILD